MVAETNREYLEELEGIRDAVETHISHLYVDSEPGTKAFMACSGLVETKSFGSFHALIAAYLPGGILLDEIKSVPEDAVTFRKRFLPYHELLSITGDWSTQK